MKVIGKTRRSQETLLVFQRGPFCCVHDVKQLKWAPVNSGKPSAREKRKMEVFILGLLMSTHFYGSVISAAVPIVS